MRIETRNGTVRVTGLHELDERLAERLQSEVSAALPAYPRLIEVDLVETRSVDCSGLGALVAVQDEVRRRNPGAVFRLSDPAPPVRQLLGLTRLHRIFTIVQRRDAATS